MRSKFTIASNAESEQHEYPLGEIFVSRTLDLLPNIELPTKPVRIKIGVPVPFEDGRDYWCPYRITGLKNNIAEHAGGIDSLQALLLALSRIHFIIFDSEEYRTGRLSWLGRKEDELGLSLYDLD